MKQFVSLLLEGGLVLVFIIGCATMEKDWERTKSENNIISYQMFLTEYPKGKFSEEARSKLNVLKGQRSYDQASRCSRYWAWDDFLRKYPNGELGEKARKQIETYKIETLENGKTISWSNLRTQLSRGNITIGVNTSICRWDARRTSPVIESMLDYIFGTPPKELKLTNKDLSRDIIHAAVPFEESNQFTVIPTLPSDFLQFVHLFGSEREIVPAKINIFGNSRSKGKDFSWRGDKVSVAILKGGSINVKVREGFKLVPTGLSGSQPSAYGYVIPGGVLFLWLTISPEVKNQSFPAKLYVQFLNKEDRSITAFSQEWPIAIQGTIRFDPDNWVPFFGGVDCKGGAAKIHENGFTLLAGTSIALKRSF